MTLAERLFDLYGGLPRAYGRNIVQSSIDSKGKRSSKNAVVHQPYTAELWQDHLDGQSGLGVIPITDEAKCNWGAIDIDTYPLDLNELEEKVKKNNLPMVVLRSKSGGAHLTAYFKHMEPCTSVRGKMAEIAVLLELGNREIYPKQVRLANKSDTGNYLNMPYFAGNKTERYAVINGTAATLEVFLDFADSIRIENVDDLKVTTEFLEISDGPPCLQTLIALKAGPGERNNVLFNLGVYARLKWESGWEDHIEEFNRSYIDQPLNHREVGSIIKSLEKKNYAYTCNNTPLCNYCSREACKGREFGVTAFQHVDVGVIIDSISKMNSEPPMWVLSLEGIRTEVETEELLDQNKFRRVCVNSINKIPGRMKPQDWDHFIRGRLSEIELIDMPIETRASDMYVHMLPQFFDSTPQGMSELEIKYGKWYNDGTRYLIRGADYISFLERANMEIDTRRMWSVFISKGIERTFVGTLELWSIPLTMYSPTNKVRYLKPEYKVNESF